MSEPSVYGYVAAGFEGVRSEFQRNLAERGELGGAMAAYWYGEKVVDLWGGKRGPNTDEPWHEDTMAIVASTTKGLAAMTVAVANSRGWLDYDAPIARYWPEFAQHGKASITVRQLLAHEAGLVFLDEPLTIERMRNLDEVGALLARQKPAWPPGSRRGYHAMTIGLYMQEIIRRVDPQHRTLGTFFHEEIATPLGVEFYIGLPHDMPASRVAVIKPMSRWRAFLSLRSTPPLLIAKILAPNSLLRRSLLLATTDPNNRDYLEIEVPAGNGVGTARAIARAYSAFAEGGAEVGITPATFAQLTAPPPPAKKDVIIGTDSCYALGYLRPSPAFRFGSSERAFGTPGAGGSFGFADPDQHLGYGYLTNKFDFHLVDDPREKALRDATYQAIRARASARAA